MIAADEAVLSLLVRGCLELPLPRDAAFVAECAKRLVLLSPEPRGFVAMATTALDEGLVRFAVQEVLESPELMVAGAVLDPSATKVHIVELLKTLAAHPSLAARMADLFDDLPAWRKYKHQDHDLFMATEAPVDYFLTDDTEALGRKLLLTAAGHAQPPSPQQQPPPWQPQPEQPLACSPPTSASQPPPPPPPLLSPLRQRGSPPDGGVAGTSGGACGGCPAVVGGMADADPLTGFLQPTGGASSIAGWMDGLGGAGGGGSGGGGGAAAGPFGAAVAAHTFGGGGPAAAGGGGGDGGGDGGGNWMDGRSAGGAGNPGGGGGPGGGPGSAVHVTIVKDPVLGLGIDLKKEGETMVVKAVKPEARFAGPRQLQDGDVIAAVGGVVCETFTKGVRLLKAAEGEIHLIVSRRRK
ncbi:unnamed protein product [Phaeothamnion confervicola]